MKWRLLWKKMEATTVESQALFKSEELLHTSHPQETILLPRGTRDCIKSLMLGDSAA